MKLIESIKRLVVNFYNPSKETKINRYFFDGIYILIREKCGIEFIIAMLVDIILIFTVVNKENSVLIFSCASACCIMLITYGLIFILSAMLEISGLDDNEFNKRKDILRNKIYDIRAEYVQCRIPFLFVFVMQAAATFLSAYPSSIMFVGIMSSIAGIVVLDLFLARLFTLFFCRMRELI